MFKKINNNGKVEQLTKMLGRGVRLIIILPLYFPVNTCLVNGGGGGGQVSLMKSLSRGTRLWETLSQAKPQIFISCDQNIKNNYITLMEYTKQ